MDATYYWIHGARRSIKMLESYMYEYKTPEELKLSRGARKAYQMIKAELYNLKSTLDVIRNVLATITETHGIRDARIANVQREVAHMITRINKALRLLDKAYDKCDTGLLHKVLSTVDDTVDVLRYAILAARTALLQLAEKIEQAQYTLA